MRTSYVTSCMWYAHICETTLNQLSITTLCHMKTSALNIIGWHHKTTTSILGNAKQTSQTRIAT